MITFRKTPDNERQHLSYGSRYDHTTVELKYDNSDATVSQMCEEFANFLRAIGYSIPIDGIGVLQDEDDDTVGEIYIDEKEE